MTPLRSMRWYDACERLAKLTRVLRSVRRASACFGLLQSVFPACRVVRSVFLVTIRDGYIHVVVFPSRIL